MCEGRGNLGHHLRRWAKIPCNLHKQGGVVVIFLTNVGAILGDASPLPTVVSYMSPYLSPFIFATN
jgi:hypothetical protein